MIYLNIEHYPDPTAGEAIRRAMREAAENRRRARGRKQRNGRMIRDDGRNNGRTHHVEGEQAENRIQAAGGRDHPAGGRGLPGMPEYAGLPAGLQGGIGDDPGCSAVLRFPVVHLPDEPGRKSHTETTGGGRIP